MTPTPEIRKAFYERLVCNLPAGPVEDGDIAWPNMPFRPVVGRMYLAPAVLFGETFCKTLGPNGFEQLAGIFRVSVYGVANTGEGEIEEVARRLTDIFRGGTILRMPGYNPVHIRNTYRNNLTYSGADARPVVVITANWVQYAQKGE